MSVLDIDPATVRKKLVKFIRQQTASAGYERGIIGLSGGLDSTVTAYLAVEALQPGNVIGLIMPYHTTNPQCQQDAEQMAGHLGICCKVISITPQIDAYFTKFPQAGRLRHANKMARERMAILYDHSAAEQALVIGTGNKSERLLGYTTIWGDMACAFAPLGSLYKTQVRQLAAELGVSEAILNKPPSANLWPDQSDEGELGFSYAEADQILCWLIDQQCSPQQVAAKGFALELVERIAQTVATLAFKSRMPPVPDIWPTSLPAERK